MKSQTLLMSDDAAVYNKPELEIFADDVACGHGATVGQLDANQLFYLMSRGIPTAQAEGMLIEAFAREVIDLVEDAPLRARCEEGLAGWLEARP
jgi:Fe-S cluster assembly protein SufD